MTHIEGNPGEIHELARYEVRPEALDEVIAAIHEFVAYVRENEPGALRYEVWQEKDHPTRFVHLFVWRDQAANRLHGDSAAVKKFAGTLYRSVWPRLNSSSTGSWTRMLPSGASNGRQRRST